MPNITGTLHAAFDVTLDSGAILSAKLHIPGSGEDDKPLDHTDQTVTVPDLPGGASNIRLAMDFDPGDPNATYVVANVTNGTAAGEGMIVNDQENPGAVITMLGEEA